MRVYILFLCLLAINACVAPITIDQLRSNGGHNISFEVNQPYQKVFADLLAQTRACYLNQPQVRQITVVGNRDNANKTGNITVEEVYAMAEHDAYLVIDVLSKNEKLTNVEAYIADKRAKAELESIKSWLSAKENKCEVKWLS